MRLESIRTKYGTLAKATPKGYGVMRFVMDAIRHRPILTIDWETGKVSVENGRY